MTHLKQHASRLALITVLSATPLALAAQDTTKPVEDETAAEAPMTDEATDSAELPETEAEAETDTAETPEAEGDAEPLTDTAETPEAETDAEPMTETADAPAMEDDVEPMTDTAEAPVASEAAPEDIAEAPAEVVKPVEGQIVMQSENTILAEDLIGSDVYSDAGEKIGEVDDLIVSLEGTVEGVVIGVGGFLGIGEKWVAIEMASLSTMTDEGGSLRLVSSATKADLEAAEPFQTAQDLQAAQSMPQDPAATDESTAPAVTN